jgi:CRISPR-associated endonuclease/helicase Cas3
MSTPLRLHDCWAKTDESGRPCLSVRDHCLNVGAVAEALWDVARPPVDRKVAVLLAASHDVGKISPGFQRKSVAWLAQFGLLEESKKRAWVCAESDHSKVSQFTIQHVLREAFALQKPDAALWAAVAGMHHGAPHFGGSWNSCENSLRMEGAAVGNIPWEIWRRELISELCETFGRPSSFPPRDSRDESRLRWTAGLVTLADWIGSDERFFPHGGGVRSISEAREIARDAVAQIGLRTASLTKEYSFEELFGFPPNPLQAATLATVREPGVYIIEAPMGMGKTEAALGAAYQLIRSGKAGGIYFALPTQVTSNLIHARVCDFLAATGESPARLIHSGSWLVDGFPIPDVPALEPGEPRREARDWFNSSKRALLGQFGVGTADQALMEVIAVKHFFLRQFALAGKVVIIDEVHSYDVFTGTLVTALVAALRRLGSTVMILSATLTTDRRITLLGGGAVPGHQAENERFPLISGDTIAPVSVEPPPAKPPVRVRFRPESDCLRDVVQAVRQGACVLWICDTVDRAQDTYCRAVAAQNEADPPVALLHSRFTFAARQSLETEWMQKLGKHREVRPNGCLLISTQIAEQSVDIDADLLVTELAPTDMLFQRLGRLWRHWGEGERRPVDAPAVWIIAEDEGLHTLRSESDKSAIRRALGKKAKVYAPYVLLRTLEQWHDKSEVRLPADIRSWIEATYRPRDESARPGWAALLVELNARRAQHEGRAQSAQNVWQLPSLPDEEGATTRLNSCPTLPLVLLTDIGREFLTLHDGTTLAMAPDHFDRATARALHRNMVRAPAWWFADKSKLLRHLPQNAANTIRLHLHGPTEAAVLSMTSRSLTADSLGTCQLEYSPSLGLVRKQGPSSSYSELPDEEWIPD